MLRKSSLLFFLLLFSGISLQAFTFDPKIKNGVGDDVVNDGSEVKLPIGLPFSINDGSGSSAAASDENGAAESKIVYTFDLPDGQGPESYHETHSAFEQARSMNASCVLIRMQSMSGALNAAENLSNEITDYDRPVMVYVNDKAIPASTLISMAADNKKNAANIKPDKRTSNKNRLVSASAKKRNYVQSALDENYRTGFSSLALEKQFSTGVNGDLDDVLTQAGLNNYTVVHYSPGFFAQFIDVCMKPVMSLLLIILIALGLRLQVNSVFPGPATFLLLVSLPLFGIPLFVGGLAGAGEFGLALFFAAIVVMTARRKSSSSLLRFAAIALFIVALTLCQLQNGNLFSDWKMPATNLLFTTLTFAAGWLLPLFISKIRRTAHTLSRA